LLLGASKVKTQPQRARGPQRLSLCLSLRSLRSLRFILLDSFSIRAEGIRMSRIIFAFNGDLESRLALHWLVQERGHQVVALSLNHGQGIYLEPLGELALELGASAPRVVDRREVFRRDFDFPLVHAGAACQSSRFLVP